MLASKTQQQRRQGEQRVMNENSTFRLTECERQHDIGEIKLAGVRDAPLTQSHGRQGGVASGQLTARFNYTANSSRDRRHCG